MKYLIFYIFLLPISVLSQEKAIEAKQDGDNLIITSLINLGDCGISILNIKTQKNVYSDANIILFRNKKITIPINNWDKGDYNIIYESESITDNITIKINPKKKPLYKRKGPYIGLLGALAIIKWVILPSLNNKKTKNKTLPDPPLPGIN